MKQVLQSLKTGDTSLIEIPTPQLQTGMILIQTQCSLISSGTENMLVQFGKAGWLEKARQQPEKVRIVWEKIQTDGLLPTIDAVQSKLEQLLPMGYCNVGRVLAIGKDVTQFSVGDRVVSNGAHAEIVSVSAQLCARIPDAVSDESAAFTVLGAVALQGIRLAQPTLGESFVVIGLGVIGLLAVQLLQAHGCRVLAIDLDAHKTALAKTIGAEVLTLADESDPIATAKKFARAEGVDGVIITANSSSDSIVHQAAQMCRKRGRIILVGVAGLSLSRADFYEKELSFQVSCAYGPGRYDDNYERHGQDYPFGFVRWTAQRNFIAVLDMLAQQSVNVATLISHRLPLTEISSAYNLLESKSKALGIIIQYSITPLNQPHIKLKACSISPITKSKGHSVNIGLIGAGNYALREILPALKTTAAQLNMVACNYGISGTIAAKKHGIAEVTTDPHYLINSADTNTIIIASQHNSHAEFVLASLAQNKNVFVEKPLCLTIAELTASKAMSAKCGERLMIGFNRRFAPHIQTIKKLLGTTSAPKVFMMTVNAGAIEPSHWTQQKQIGGGRLLGEACHFIDLLFYLAQSTIVYAEKLSIDSLNDKVSIFLKFADGSHGVIHYLANGHKAVAKERLEVFVDGKVLQLDNFRRLRGFGWHQFKRENLWRQKKGQRHCLQKFIQAIEHKTEMPIPLSDIFAVMEITLTLANA